MSTSRRVGRPLGRIELMGSHGIGTPQPGPGGFLGPTRIINPIGPGSPPANAAGNAIQRALQSFETKLGEQVKSAAGKVLSAGEVALGLLLLIAGLLLATGAPRQIGRLGRVASRGFVR